MDQTVFQYGPFVMTTREEIQNTLMDCKFNIILFYDFGNINTFLLKQTGSVRMALRKRILGKVRLVACNFSLILLPFFLSNRELACIVIKLYVRTCTTPHFNIKVHQDYNYRRFTFG